MRMQREPRKPRSRASDIRLEDDLVFKKFRLKCKEMNICLKAMRDVRKVKEFRPILQVKLRGNNWYY